MRISRLSSAATVAFLCLFAASVFAAQPPRLRIIATTFPLCDWTRQILGQQTTTVELVQMQDNGIDLHSFQPTARDLSRLAQCDLFLYIGGESDTWVSNALRAHTNPRRQTLNLLETLGNTALEESHLEGMENHDHHHGEAKHDHDHHHGEAKHDHDEEHELDEHIWLSLRRASRLCQAIAVQLARLDPPHATEYQSNCQAYQAKLLALDKRYANAVQTAHRKYLLFADRFPFRYLADDYGLTCFAAFSGCSAETEASFKTIAFLASKVDELSLPAVLALESRQHKIPETVVRTAKSKGVKILTVDSLQSATSRDA
ncbi:MAG: zinc ABC transporter substrate-binding protein, partial [Victivallales bacterium]|nr:zinc ABC transporter substrate-binding protein [Victivallales bacterium]